MSANLPYELEWWAAFGSAAGGIATTLGIGFAVYEFATWKRSKLRERRADVAAAVARALDSACDAMSAALRNPSAYVTPDAETPYLELETMRAGFVHRCRHVREVVDAFQRELTIAAYYFTVAELEACLRVVPWWTDTLKSIHAAFPVAVGRLPAPDARRGFEAVFRERYEAAWRVRSDALLSLDEGASYAEHVGPFGRAWRFMMAEYRATFGNERRP